MGWTICFPSTAARSGFVYRTPDPIREKTLAPHRAMPEVAQVLNVDVDDLVAYLTSLEPE